MYLQTITQPAVEPVTVDEVKARLRLTTTVDDGTIATHITAAREFAEKMTRRALAYKSYALFLGQFPLFQHEPIRIPAPPLIAVSAIKYYDSTYTQQTWDPTEYKVASMQQPGLVFPAPGFMYPCAGMFPAAVEIDFTAGYDYATGPVCPEHLREGIRQLAVHIYEHPEAVSSEGLKEAPLALRSFFESNKIYVF